MTSVAAEVSLHCMICYEEFNTRDRAPVVLPCGHTYICEVCAKRLKKCMECREPLFWAPPAQEQKTMPSGMNLNSGRSPQPLRYTGGSVNRGRFSPGPQTPPHPAYGGIAAAAPAPTPKKEVPLPLPRNIVLLEMIEAAEMQARMIEKERLKRAHSTRDGEDDDDKLIEPTLAGMTALAGACGTYAVREPLGLAVLPFDPNLQHDKRKAVNAGEEKKVEESREPFTIEDGQTVQVVAAEDGVYKLAREVGYIMASVNQLVKVGGPLEKSCRLEGMLDSVMEKRMQLQKELDEVDLLVNGLRNQIKDEQDQPEEHPVISARKESISALRDELDVGGGGPQTPTTPPKRSQTQDLLLHSSTTDSTDVGLDYHRTPEHRPIYENSPARSCPMPSTEHADVTDPRLQQPFMDDQTGGLPRYRVSNDDADLGITGGLLGFGCGSGLFGERLLEDGPQRNRIQGIDSMLPSFDDDDQTLGGRSFMTARTTGTTGTSRGYRPTRTGSFDGGTVNFRTGMSGHAGLLQSKKHASPNAHNRREVRMMSDHRGVVQARGNQS
ncbi:unnamed protein product [Cylindrotheca closterium]|uniref:RING-type domain-containing protein n=1 Tax=Cylindrotheca closterium TaxID=2856 RepID=A0AAD2CQ26_9STRA|nr:unnamed protein product [Cylindrotheca closterium]